MSVSVAVTSKLDVVEIEPLIGDTAFVTTAGPGKTRITHNLGLAQHIFVTAANQDGERRYPRVDTVDNNTLEVTFDPPGLFKKRVEAYKLVISCWNREVERRHRSYVPEDLL